MLLPRLRHACAFGSLLLLACSAGGDASITAGTLGMTSSGSTSGPSSDATPTSSSDSSSNSDSATTTGGSCEFGAEGCPCGPNDSCDDGLWCQSGLCLECSSCGACGDQSCDANESCETCAADCGACPGCGDGECVDEKCSTCPADCGVCPGCGDGECGIGETCNSCEQDCGICDVCSNAQHGDGWYCGSSISGNANILYQCSGGQTVDTQGCVHGCASCEPGVADVCRQFAGQEDGEACPPLFECDYDDDPSGCSGESQWCYQGECTSCSAGFFNCDGTRGCECSDLCIDGACVECDYDADPSGCFGDTQWCYQNSCQSCSAGFSNCDGTAGCECDGICDAGGNCIECAYDEDPDGCNSDTQWCYQNNCQSCSQGFANCDHTAGCECQGTCNAAGDCIPS